MESRLKIPNVDISRIRKYSLADLDAIDFSTSDDSAIVVERLKNMITLEKNIDNFWNEEHELLLWQFVIDPDSVIFMCFLSDDALFVTCDIPKVNVKELFYFLKVSSGKLYATDYNKLLFGTFKAPIFESLYSLFSNLFAPVFFESQDWLKCIKTDYQKFLTEFLSELFRINNELSGEIIFYVPKQVLHKDIDSILGDKLLLNQVEKAVMQWIWLLLATLIKQDSDVTENSGPLEEIKFWQTKHSDLKNILSQLNRDEVKLCIESLKSANLASYYKFNELRVNLLVEFEVTINNIKFLSLLKNICELLQESSLTDIPNNLSILLDLTRIIYNNSSYYKDNNNISNLLGKVNNFAVKVISFHVPLEEIFFNSHSIGLKDKLFNIISCCNSWLNIFEHSEKVHRKCSSFIWSVEPISPLVNLFIHRCEELVEICDYKKNFHCNEELKIYVPNHKGFEIAEHFQKIKSSFQALLSDLSQSMHVALNVNKADWYDYFKKFKEAIFNLYVAVSKLMSNYFENLNSIEEGILILSMFQKFFEKQVVKHELRKCVKYLYELFFKEVNYVKKLLVEIDSSELHYPYFGGRAFRASILPQKIKQLYKVMNEGKNIWPSEYDEDIEEFYQQTLRLIEEYKHALLLKWSKTIPKEPYAWLSDPIFIRKENSELIYINLSKDVLNLIYELFYWNKTGIEIPQSIIHLHQKSDFFLNRIFKMTDCIRSHNRILYSLQSEEKIFFSNILLSLEEKIKPAVDGLDWSAPQSKAIETLNILKNINRFARETLENYEMSREKCEIISNEISKKSLFFADFESALDLSEFLKTQSDFKDNAVEEIKSCVVCYCQEINRSVDLMKITKDYSIARMFISKKLDSLLGTIVECYASYLAEIGYLFGASRKNKLHVLLKSSLTLNGKQSCQPTRLLENIALNGSDIIVKLKFLSFIPGSTELKEELNKMIEDTYFNLSNLLLFEGLFFEEFDYREKFHIKVSGSKAIMELKLDFDYGLQLLYEAEKSYENEWNPYSSLWKTEKCYILKAFQDNDWKASDFENTLDSFLKVRAKIPDVPRYKILEFVIVDCQPLKDSAIERGEKWKVDLGNILSQISCTNLDNAYHLIELVNTKFQDSPKNLEDLKFSIDFLRKSKQYSSEVEKTFDSIREYFDVLIKFEIPINEKSLDQLKNLDYRWKTLEKDFQSYYTKLQRVQAWHLRQFLEYHEEIENQINILEVEINQKGPFEMDYGYEDALNLILSYIKALNFLQEQEYQMKHDASFFNIELKPLDTLEIVKNKINCLKTSWSYVLQYFNCLIDWADVAVMNFYVIERKKVTDELQDNMKVLRAQKGFHHKLLDELSSQLDDLDHIYKVIADFQEPTFQTRHWNMLENILYLDHDDCEKFFKSDEFTFQFLKKFDTSKISYEVRMVTHCAKKEHEIEQTLNFTEQTLKGIYFPLDLNGDKFKIEDCSGVVDIIEDQLTTLEVLKTSKYVHYFSDLVEDLDNSLRLILNSIELMETLQKKFLPLEVIFSEQIVQAKLPEESFEFQEATILWTDVCNALNSNKLAWQTCHKEGFIDSLYVLNKKIEGAQQLLNTYLDSKRCIFPRFYFISNFDLIVIVGSKKPTDIQLHLKKLFDSLHRLEIIEKVEEKMRDHIVLNQVLGMYSPCYEYVPFPNPLILEGPVESWLLDTEKMMHSALQTSLSKCLHALTIVLSKEEYDFSASKWLTKFSGQICLLSLMIQWTAEVTQGIKTVQETAVTSALKAVKKKWRTILNQLSKRLRLQETEPLVQKKVMNIILSIVHSCDVIESLLKYVCNDVGAFEWIVQLRYYMNYEKNLCLIRQTEAVFNYGFEYLGNTERLVLTPNTDRCFLTITTALNLHQGTLLKGCSNSGKTETLKEVGKALGKYVLIVNCSENMTHFSLVHMLSGLAQIGAWGLFERFNLLRTEIMSVFSQEVKNIFNSQAKEQGPFMSDGICLKDKCGIFLAFDSGSNFNMPSGLSDIFRPYSIISPDCSYLIEVYLFTFGFQEVKILAADIDLIFKKMREQLSRKPHYSFGLREIIHFLKYLKEMKRLDSNLSEVELIAFSLRETTVQRLDTFDIPVFENILESVLGSIKSDHNSKPELINEIKKILEDNDLQPDSYTIESIKDLYDLKKYCHSIILLGESGSGKTTTWKILKEFISHHNQSDDRKPAAVHTYILNANAFTLKELFGFFTKTKMWSDGLFSTSLRKACLNERAKESWLILNGPIDSDWVGYIATLIDANKLLTLPNGERIMLSNKVTLIFETTNIANCSPSILSCMGIVCHKENTARWKNFLFSWIHKFEKEDLISIVKTLIEEYLENILDFAFDVLKSLKSTSITKLNCVSSFSWLMDIYVKNVSLQKVDSTCISKIFWMAIVWSIGAVISENEKNEFDIFIRNLNFSLNDLESIYSYNLDANFEWIKWNSYLPEKWQPPKNISFENWFVPTAKCISHQHIMLQLIKALHPVLLVGNSRCGKTAMVEDLFSFLDPDSYVHHNVNILPQISSNKFQTIVENQLEKKAGGIMLPHFKKKMIYFLDNIDSISCENSGSKPLLELLAMAVDNGFWYDPKTWTMNHLRNVSYVASSSSPLGFGNEIPKPLLNRFCVFHVPELKDDMKNIFLTLLNQKIPSISLETQRLLNSLSSGTVKAYELIREKFPPTPTKLHYLFHLRSIKKILFNLMNINPELLDNRVSITKFWFHEFSREFSDLLIDYNDCLEMSHILSEVLEKEFLTPVTRICVQGEPLFVKFLTPDMGFNEIQDIDVLKDLFESFIKSYNRENPTEDLQIVLFKQNIDHLVRIVRALESPHGNIILLGARGTGRRTLCKIGAFILKYEVFEITSDKDFDEQIFKTALQKLLWNAGVERKDVLFLISNYQINDNFYLEYLTDVIAIGVPPDLFSSYELREIYSEILKNDISLKGENDCFKKFASNIKSHFHLAFCLSYTSSHYKKCILKYSDLFKHSTVDWFDEWPIEALESISENFLMDFFEPPLDSKILQNFSDILCDMHLNILRYAKKEKTEDSAFETSSSFVKLVDTFKRLLVNKQEKVEFSLKRLLSGLQKINETQDKVNEIAIQTKDAHEKLVIATRECDEALTDIKAKREIVEQKQKIIEEKKIEIENKEKVCKKIELAAQEDLNAAMPALDEAKKALEALNKRDIGEIKSYAKPPELVSLVLQAVMILRDSEPSWAEAKRQLGSPNFLKELIEYDKDNIPDKALDDVEKIIKMKDFKPEKVGKVSFAAKSLCLWVNAVYMYGRIYKKVKPKIERLRLVQEELNKLQKTLNDLFAELDALHEAISQLEQEHDLLMKKKEEYANRETELSLKLARAESIMESLHSEKKRWQFKVATLQEKKRFVTGDSFLASGYLTYLGPYDQYFRLSICSKWKTSISTKFALNNEFNLAEFFVEDDVANEWKMCGLPSDQYSFESASIVKENLSWSFLIDPEGQATEWVKNSHSKIKMKFIDYQDPKYVLLLELAISEGFPVLIENVNPKLNLIINSLLKISKNQNICFNGKEMKMHPNFHLYLSTKLSYPIFSSYAAKELCIVNFSMKQKGLEDQLLPIIVKYERPDLELIKEKLVKDIINCKKHFTVVEDKILKLLSRAVGSLLDDEVLVQALQQCKSESIEVEMELTSHQKTETRIDRARDEYRPCAKLASILYFVLADMRKVNPIYIFALNPYLNLFLNSIQKSQKDPDILGRIKKVNTFHQYSVYRYACRCILNKHALLFLFHMCTQILLADNKLSFDEYGFFIHGGKANMENYELMNPCSQWLSQSSWNQIVQLELLPKFLGITVSFDEAPKLWFEWYSSQEPENEFLPGNWRNISSEFEKLLLIRCLRPDRIKNGISNLIASNLGQNFLAYSEINMSEIFGESSAKKPFTLFSVSSDALAEVIVSSCAQEHNSKYCALSLREGQGNAASQLIVDCVKSGDWAFISNSHLLQSWLPTLEKIVNILQTVKAHPNFRLWLSSSPIKTFPSSILLNSVILSLDSPKGIRANMLDLYRKFEANQDSEFISLESKFKSLLYSLSFFHSILLCRERFHNLGWNGVYEFSYSDFKASSYLLQLYLDKYREAPWDALQEMIAEIVYGGHFTDKRDKELMIDYFNQYICDDVSAKYKLASAENYSVPDDGPIDLFLESVKKIPSWDEPEIFGQHKNADIPCKMYDAKQLFKDMAKIRKQEISVENFEPEVSSIITKIKSEIPALLDIDAVVKILKDKPEPYSYVLIQEVQQYNSLLKIVSESLQNIEKGIVGKQMMTEALLEQVSIIQRMEMPPEWMKIYSSLKPLGSWIIDLKERIKFFSNWISARNLPVKIWLSAFTNPLNFLHAALLTAAKNSGVMLKDLRWEHHVLTLDEKYINEAPEDGIYIRGLYLEGAGWDRANSILTDPEPLHLITSLPVVHFKPVIESSIRGVYNCPCYYNSKRTDKEGSSLELFSIDLKTKKEKGHWRKCGTCLLLSDST